MIKMLSSLHHHACVCPCWCFPPAAPPGVLLHGGQRNPDRRPLPGRVPPQRARRHAQVSPHEGQSDVRVRPWGRRWWWQRHAPRARRIRPRISFFCNGDCGHVFICITRMALLMTWLYCLYMHIECAFAATRWRCLSVFQLLRFSLSPPVVSPIVRRRQMALWLWGKNSQQWRS